jgi:hypothetical protein
MNKKFLFFIFSTLFILPGCSKESKSNNIQIREPIINEILGGNEKLIEVPSQTSKLCISGGINIENKDEMIKSLDILKSAGFDVIRRDFLWEELEPEENKIDEVKLQRYKEFVNEAKKRNIEVISLVVYGNWWASDEAKSCYQACLESGKQEGECKSSCTNTKLAPDPQKYGKFAGFLAESFPEVNMFEIWNEPNWIMFSQPNSPEKYSDIFFAARSSIKKYGEKKEVILGGLLMHEIPNSPSSLLYNWREFLGNLMERNILNLADSIAFHPYIGPKPLPYPPSLPPEDSKNSAGSLIYYISSLRKLIKSFTSEEKPIHITEIGWPANYSDVTGETYGSDRFISEELQASFIIRAFAISSMLGVKTFCIYTLKDLPDDFQAYNNAEKYFGILRENFTPKKSYEAIKFTMPKIKGKYMGDVKTEIVDETERNKEEGEKKIVFSPAFEGEDKKLRAIFWVVGPDGTEQKEKIKVKAYIPENSEIFSIYGERITNYEKGKGYIILEISSSPQIAEIK